MEQSILKSTKKILGLAENYDAFDADIITFINTAFGVLHQLGVGPTDEAYFIEEATPQWGDLNLPRDQENLVKTYIFLRVRLLFDPPPTSFALSAMQTQLTEYETRLSYLREDTIPYVPDIPEEVDV